MIERKIVTVTQRLNTPEFNVSFPAVVFRPDEVIVRNLSVVNRAVLANTSYMLELYSTLANTVMISQGITASNISSSNQAYEIHYPLNRDWLSGTFFFRAWDSISGAVISNPDITISLQLEFVKYS